MTAGRLEGHSHLDSSAFHLTITSHVLVFGITICRNKTYERGFSVMPDLSWLQASHKPLFLAQVILPADTWVLGLLTKFNIYYRHTIVKYVADGAIHYQDDSDKSSSPNRLSPSLSLSTLYPNPIRRWCSVPKWLPGAINTSFSRRSFSTRSMLVISRL